MKAGRRVVYRTTERLGGKRRTVDVKYYVRIIMTQQIDVQKSYFFVERGFVSRWKLFVFVLVVSAAFDPLQIIFTRDYAWVKLCAGLNVKNNIIICTVGRIENVNNINI